MPATANPIPNGHDQDRWENVPEIIRQYHTEQEWLWLSDAEKARLIQDMTEPEA